MDNYNLLDQSDHSGDTTESVNMHKHRQSSDAANLQLKITVTEPNGETSELSSGLPVQKTDTQSYGEIFKMDSDDVQESYQHPYSDDYGSGYSSIPLGYGGGIDDDDNSIFELLSLPDCAPFYMTGLQNCKQGFFFSNFQAQASASVLTMEE